MQEEEVEKHGECYIERIFNQAWKMEAQGWHLVFTVCTMESEVVELDLSVSLQLLYPTVD